MKTEIVVRCCGKPEVLLFEFPTILALAACFRVFCFHYSRQFSVDGRSVSLSPHHHCVQSSFASAELSIHNVTFPVAVSVKVTTHSVPNNSRETLSLSACVCVCGVGVGWGACVRACVHACVRACVRAFPSIPLFMFSPCSLSVLLLYSVDPFFPTLSFRHHHAYYGVSYFYLLLRCY